MYCVCVFSVQRESPAFSEGVLSQLVSEQDRGKTHTKESINYNNIVSEKHLAHIRTIVVSLGGKIVLHLPVVVRIKASVHHTMAKSIEEILMVQEFSDVFFQMIYQECFLRETLSSRLSCNLVLLLLLRVHRK
jgi:hypothetical protein